VSPDLISYIWSRAGHRCEYCHLPSAGYPLPLQMDHIIARQHGGETDANNLALACVHCNRHKGPNIGGIDPATGSLTRLFHPRRDVWQDRFEWRGVELRGRTPVGRVTIEVLAINDPDIRAVRRQLMNEHVYPLE
jgi:hypothetical protein